MEEPVVAVIPTYRPSEDAVGHVERIADIVDAVVVSDDASPCTFDARLRTLAGASGRPVVRHRRNRGIARSLNAGLRLAMDRGAPWLLTVDQDTLVPADYVDTLVAGARRARDAGLTVGVIAPAAIDDAGGVVGYPTRDTEGIPTTAEVFQTGALWSVPGLVAAGGFDESLGIDAVDAAACLALRRLGYHVVLETGARLEHRWGQAEQVTVLGRVVAVTHHSPERRTTMVRNRLRLAPQEFLTSPAQGFRSLRRLGVNTALAVTVEDDRWAKAKASARGLWPAPKR